jgi:hypothetical protein
MLVTIVGISLPLKSTLDVKVEIAVGTMIKEAFVAKFTTSITTNICFMCYKENKGVAGVQRALYLLGYCGA